MSGEEVGKVVLLRPDVMSVEQFVESIAREFPQADALIVAVFDRGTMRLKARGATPEWFALAGASLLKHAVAAPDSDE